MKQYDVVIIGSGVSGSVASIILGKLGYSTLLIEKGRHPRFAIGESSTPVMSKKIRHLGQVYDIPEFIELSSYDRIMEGERPVRCAPKELFHYYIHKDNETNILGAGRYPEILVQTPDVDTQFLRADLDERLVEYAQNYGAEYLSETEVTNVEINDDGVVVTLLGKDGQTHDVAGQFLLDGTGFRSILGQKFDLRIADEELDTPLRSRSIFTHFVDVGTLEDALGNEPDFVARTKIDRLRATQHHCFDGGWFWFIPLGNGLTSVGLNLDMDKYPMNEQSGEEEFWSFVERFPVVKSMLSGRKTTMPFIKTGRLQFRTKQAVGDRWALLPAAAMGMDAWFSTGLGLNLVSIHRLVEALHTKVFANKEFKREHLVHYEQSMFTEWYYITRMINGIYKSFKHFEVFKSYCFSCFMGAESFVHTGGLKRPNDPSALLLNVGDNNFIKHFETIYSRVLDLNGKEAVEPDESEFLRSYIQVDMSDFNYRDYGNPMYDGVHYKLDKHSRFYDKEM